MNLVELIDRNGRQITRKMALRAQGAGAPPGSQIVGPGPRGPWRGACPGVAAPPS